MQITPMTRPGIIGAEGHGNISIAAPYSPASPALQSPTPQAYAHSLPAWGLAQWRAELTKEMQAVQNSLTVEREVSAEVAEDVETSLATIERARNAAKLSAGASGRQYWTSVADDAANDANRLLKIRRHDGPIVPGRPAPPSVATIQRALDRYRRTNAARIRAMEAHLCVLFCWLHDDPTWESAWNALNRAEQDEREAASWI